MIPWIFLIALLVVYSATLPSLLKRAGMNSALGYIPLVNFYPFLKMIKRPWWWLLLLLCPGVNLLVLVIMNIELGIAFNKRSTKDQWFFGALPWVALPTLAFKEKEQAFVGPRDWKGKKKSTMREWGEAIVFAIIAASVIRTFFIEAFTIPTPSMEKSMLVGDYLFVSKVSYGAKIPQTPMSVPFVHNAMPGSLTNSYVDWFTLPYFRLPGFGDVERFDPVVFNFPNGDTVMIDPFYVGHDYFSYVRKEAFTIAKKNYGVYAANRFKYEAEARKNFAKGICNVCREERGQKAIGGVKGRPVDKKENYVKRCIGLPGENLKIVDGQVFVNDNAIENPAGLMFSYIYKTENIKDMEEIWDKCKVNIDDRKVMVRDGEARGFYPKRALPKGIEYYRDSSAYIIGTSSFNAEDVEWLTKNTKVKMLEKNVNRESEVLKVTFYPNSTMEPFSNWNEDNYGPIHIPAKAEKIELTAENIELYRRVIDVYENNEWLEKDGKVFINGAEATSYTFKQDYYWMMGDNRHQSADSRFWGFVPEDHVVGKPVFTWFSKENAEYQEGGEIRWKRMFRLVD
jgi:signal peptidase I